MKVKEQIALFEPGRITDTTHSYLDRLTTLLRSDLDFHSRASNYSSHNFHSFPAKFPPQLPKLFIEELTEVNDVVLDPMAGSGTTILETYLTNRRPLGFDIDPLAIKIAKAKTFPLNKSKLIELKNDISANARRNLQSNSDKLKEYLKVRFDVKTKDFIDYWFLPKVQLELAALYEQIEKIDRGIQEFFPGRFFIHNHHKIRRRFSCLGSRAYATTQNKDFAG